MEAVFRIGAVLFRLIVPQRPEGLVQEGGEEEGGGALGLSLLGAATAGEAYEGFAGGGVSGEGLDEGVDVEIGRASCRERV